MCLTLHRTIPLVVDHVICSHFWHSKLFQVITGSTFQFFTSRRFQTYSILFFCQFIRTSRPPAPFARQFLFLLHAGQDASLHFKTVEYQSIGSFMIRKYPEKCPCFRCRRMFPRRGQTLSNSSDMTAPRLRTWFQDLGFGQKNRTLRSR